MQIKIGKNTYEYDPETNEASDPKVHSYIKRVKARGFDLGMDFNEFERYIEIISLMETEELYHIIWASYNHLNTHINRTDITIRQAEFEKILGRMKRYEHYLYKIIMRRRGI